ncbi:MAG: SPOR domain-containing protein [Bacteroidales bacterium]
MKNTGLLLAIAAVISVAGCKSKSYTSGNDEAYSDSAPYVGKSTEEETKDDSYTTSVYNKDNTIPEKPQSTKEEEEESRPSISMEEIELAAKEEAKTSTRTEDVEAVEDDMNYAGNSAFFVIVGSFAEIDNARKEKQNFIDKGYEAVILKSNKNGYYRVSIGSYTEKPRAYLLINEVKNKYSQYNDSWVLIKE